MSVVCVYCFYKLVSFSGERISCNVTFPMISISHSHWYTNDRYNTIQLGSAPWCKALRFAISRSVEVAELETWDNRDIVYFKQM